MCFWGVLTNSKSYELLKLHTNQNFVSNDVKYYEFVFAFKVTSIHHYLKPLPTPIPFVSAWSNDHLYIVEPYQPNLLLKLPSNPPRDMHHSLS